MECYPPMGERFKEKPCILCRFIEKSVGNHTMYDVKDLEVAKSMSGKAVKFIDLFCGLGGFRIAAERAIESHKLEPECVFSSDIDEHCQMAYEANFGERPNGNIEVIESNDIPDHDLLLAGFPCQPFSIIGNMKGFEDFRGTLFFHIARILEAKRPAAFVLENVKMLKGHDGGRTLKTIMRHLNKIGYQADYCVLNALDFGLPQKRERVWIVGTLNGRLMDWPIGGVPMTPLRRILERQVDKKHFATDYIVQRRHAVMKPTSEPTIWHENKSGHVSAYPYSCALRAGASYNYLLVDGRRRLTPREMLRLQGFPDSYKIAVSESQTRKQAGNSLPINVAESVIKAVLGASGISDKRAQCPGPNFERSKSTTLLTP